MRGAFLGIAGLLVLTAALGCGGGGSEAPAPPSRLSIGILPGAEALSPGDTRNFKAVVAGTTTPYASVIWKVNGLEGGSDAVGTISPGGLYTTPFPVSATVTVSAVDRHDATISASVPLTLAIRTEAGPSLTVDASSGQHAISPLIYGMNWIQTDALEAMAKEIRLGVQRWGGNGTTRYNYLLDVGNLATDWYWETLPNSNTAYPDTSDFNTLVDRTKRIGAQMMGTIPLIGWTTKRERACSFPRSLYPAQQAFDPYDANCGNGVKPDGSFITGNDPALTSTPIDEAFAKGWVTYLVNRYGNAASGGVEIYSLDNEPELWQWTHRDVHPALPGYDEITERGLSYAAAIKEADPTAQVCGPAIANWMGYFYSPIDWHAGWKKAPNFYYSSDPVDREAHGNLPLIEYYLQRFKAHEEAHHVRLLDYLDLHGYYATASTAAAGTTDIQRKRLDSTRAYWDPAYVDSTLDPAQPATSPRLIPRMKEWIAANYPGTLTAISEYDWGAKDHINGAVAQAELLGIFGREGLDLATCWGTPDPVTQKPGVMAFKLFRNYDGAGTGFGETSIAANSGDGLRLSVFAALRGASAATVIVINKGFANLTSTLAFSHLVPAGPLKVFQYSHSNLNQILQLPDADPGTSITATYPAMSITVYEVPL